MVAPAPSIAVIPHAAEAPANDRISSVSVTRVHRDPRRGKAGILPLLVIANSPRSPSRLLRLDSVFAIAITVTLPEYGCTVWKLRGGLEFGPWRCTRRRSVSA